MTLSKPRAVVAMSGGVDSSVTAALLKEQGYDVIGMTMQIWDYNKFASKHDCDSTGSCCSPDDVHDARRVAEALDIPFYVVNFEQAFQREVIDRFCDDYFSGLTPNPCVLCNQVLKFELLLRRARELEAQVLATGHYAVIKETAGQFHLHQGVDDAKDQSYFLYTLTQEQMRFVRFPLGGMSKPQVRQLADRYQLPTAQKSESQDICFVPDGDYVRFLEEERPGVRMKGRLVHVSGQELGQHEGTYRFTIGQRKGLGLSWTEPLYVVGIDTGSGDVIVGEKAYLEREGLRAGAVNWIGPEPREPIHASCRIRYRHAGVPALITPQPDGDVEVHFDAPQKGVTPGQSVVFYRDDEVLGGGWIR